VIVVKIRCAHLKRHPEASGDDDAHPFLVVSIPGSLGRPSF